jgi:hypothetical protein
VNQHPVQALILHHSVCENWCSSVDGLTSIDLCRGVSSNYSDYETKQTYSTNTVSGNYSHRRATNARSFDAMSGTKSTRPVQSSSDQVHGVGSSNGGNKAVDPYVQHCLKFTAINNTCRLAVNLSPA